MSDQVGMLEDAIKEAPSILKEHDDNRLANHSAFLHYSVYIVSL
jgi:hypothetical protein